MLQLELTLKGTSVYYWYSSSFVHVVEFVEWCKTKNLNGQENSDEIGVGAVVLTEIDKKGIMSEKKRHQVLRPYWTLYRTYEGAIRHRKEDEILRPLVSDLLDKLIVKE